MEIYKSPVRIGEIGGKWLGSQREIKKLRARDQHAGQHVGGVRHIFA